MTRTQRVKLKSARRIKAIIGIHNRVSAFRVYDTGGKAIITYPDKLHTISPERLLGRILQTGKFNLQPRRVNQTVQEYITVQPATPATQRPKRRPKPAFVPSHVKFR